jgi:hypothetical protein
VGNLRREALLKELGGDKECNGKQSARFGSASLFRKKGASAEWKGSDIADFEWP